MAATLQRAAAFPPPHDCGLLPTPCLQDAGGEEQVGALLAPAKKSFFFQREQVGNIATSAAAVDSAKDLLRKASRSQH